ncbi:MAG: MBL fold metallo-hydrolase [Clostridia bacterium]|nr:MBL fold metallo-hydrolase [Clostridia bacterium]
MEETVFNMLFSPLCSGSGGNASYAEAGGARLLIDAGLPARRVEALLREIGAAPEALDGILVTHEHSDHIAGVGVLSRRYDLPVYANAGCWAKMRPALGDIRPRNLRVVEPGREFFIRSLGILPFPTPHDAASPVGYALRAEGRRIALMTDIGHVSDGMLEAVAGVDLLLIEANHDVDMLRAGGYPYALKMRILSARGHLSNEDAGRVLARLYRTGLRSAILGHLSRDNNTPELALLTVQSVLEEAGIGDMALHMALRDRPCGLFEL